MKRVMDDLLMEAKADPEIQAKVKQVTTIRRLYFLYSECGCCQQSLNEKWENYPLLCDNCEVMKEIKELLTQK